MLIKGLLLGTSDIDVVTTTVSVNTKVLYLGDPSSAPAGIDWIKATGLIPDYDTLALYVDGQMGYYEDRYIKSLGSQIASETFATIIAALSKGINILLYFPKEVLEMKYPVFLLKYIEGVFGIRTQIKSQPFGYNETFDAQNLRLLYLFNLIPPVDYVMIVDQLDPIVINKLMKELPEDWEIPRLSPGSVPTDATYAQVCEVIENKKKQIAEYGHPLVKLFTPLH